MPKEHEHTKKTKRHHSHTTHSAHPAKRHKQVFDVVPPGKAPASATSRPVIPPTSAVPDDQFVPGAPRLASDPFEKHSLLDSKQKKALGPVAAEPDQPSAAEPTAPVLPANAKSAPLADTAAGTPAVVQASTESRVVPSIALDQPSANNQPQTAPEREDERTAGHLALEQVVETDESIENQIEPDAFQRASAASAGAAPSPAAQPTALPAHPGTDQPRTIDDLLAESGAPILDNDTPQDTIISHHSKGGSVWMPILIFVLVVLVAAVVLNLLLDADIITTTLDIPHTDFL